LRRAPLSLVVLAALVAAVPAAAGLRPVRRDFGELRIPRVQAGEIKLPPGHARGRIRVIVQLPEAPLARWSRSLSTTAGTQRLQVGTASSQAYLARLARSQEAAVAQLRRAVPAAAVQHRYRILLNGFALELPVRHLPKLARLGFVRKLSPSVRYTLELNDSPSIIGASQYHAATGANGEGMKIAVVDDGVDPQNAFFSPSGFQYPAGFPRGGRKWTTPKVIVARAFPGPHAGRRGRIALDPRDSFHGTHVAGIAAGVAGTTAPAGGRTRPSDDGRPLRRRATRLDRQLSRLHRADAPGQRREHARGRRRLRGGCRRRHGRRQLLRRRSSDGA
jgi:subtilisin family serine protease